MDDIIDLEESSPGVYEPSGKRITKSVRKKIQVEQTEDDRFNEFLESVIEGRKVMNKLFKAFGG